MYIFVAVLGGILFLELNYAALAQNCTADLCSDDYHDITNVASGCSRVTRTCYCKESVASCMRCKDGYTQTQSSVTLSGGGSVKYYYCKSDNCTLTPSYCSGKNTGWVAGNTGYQKNTTYTFDDVACACDSSTVYRCADGFWGASINGTTGCTRCLALNGIYGQSSAGSTVITSCYMPSGAAFSDDTGTGAYNENCYYSN